MTGDRLIEEARRLARPCAFLGKQGDTNEVAAIWGGRGVVPAPQGPYRHRLSLDTRFHPENAPELSGCLSIYTNEEDTATGVVAIDRALGRLPAATDGVPLFARRATSLPPPGAVLQFGSPDIQEWLAAQGWQPQHGYYYNLADTEAADTYELVYQNQCPLYWDLGEASSPLAVLGGWHCPWPENDWDELLDYRFIAWTFADAEPFVEVWYRNGDFRVIQRIT